MIIIINAAGCGSRTLKVEYHNIETHIRAQDTLANEAKILKAYTTQDDHRLAVANPIAYCFATAEFLFDESEVGAVEDPSLIARVEVIWVD